MGAKATRATTNKKRICLTDRCVPAHDDHVTADDSAWAQQSNIQLLLSAVRPNASRLPQAIEYTSRAPMRNNEHGLLIKRMNQYSSGMV